MKLPEGFVPPVYWERYNRAHAGAYLKGWRAFHAGESIGACPYVDRRTHRGAICWSRSFITAWRDGWRAARKHAQ